MNNNLEPLRYKHLAFFVIRDALGFYFGIPKFLDNLNIEEVIETKLQEKIKNKEVSDIQREKYRRLITKSVAARVNFLEEDHKFCEDVLFTNNLWLELLNIDPSFFQVYLSKLSDESIDELAIVPNWTMRDESLRRPYLNADLSVKSFKLL